jgi:hypothetical protein
LTRPSAIAFSLKLEPGSFQRRIAAAALACWCRPQARQRQVDQFLVILISQTAVFFLSAKKSCP